MSSKLTVMEQSRHDKLRTLIDQGVEPYNPEVNRTHTSLEAHASDDLEVNVVGRIMSLRGHGKIQFADLFDESGKIQLAFKADEVMGVQWDNLALLDTGDFIEVSGKTFTTKAGERTVQVKIWKLLSKSIQPLPSQWYGLKDKEDRFRKRYVDLILNPEVKATLDKRWAIERAIREYLWSQNYKEVETPVLQNLYGGTNARPFTTHLNALDIDMFLRVAPELYLKRLIVGGYERIFEIARNFRNEGMDQTHQPEFTMMELYEAYADYHRIMDLTEGLFKHVAQTVNGTLELKVEDKSIDLSGNWPRITIDEALKKYVGIDSATITDDEIQAILDREKFKVPGVSTRNKALFVIFDHLVPPHLQTPTWVIDYPQEVSPLARKHRTKEGLVERFECYIGGKEICDGWTEIVSSLEQRSRFENEQRNLKAGDDEAQPLDEEFLDALSHGCPPLGGIGIGIDRLVMFISNTWSIREVIGFPLMRPENTQENNIKTVAADSNHSIQSEITEQFPGMFYAYCTIKNVKIEKQDQALEERKAQIVASNIHPVEAIAELKSIAGYRSLFKATHVWGDGRRPSPEALLRRLAQNKGLYTINTAVDAYNLSVIETAVGLGGFDMDKISFPLDLRLSKENETMRLLGDDAVTKLKAGEIVYADQDGPITLDLNYRDIDKTKITESTQNIILYADGAPNLSKEEVVAALQKGANYINQFCGGEISEIHLVD